MTMLLPAPGGRGVASTLLAQAAVTPRRQDRAPANDVPDAARRWLAHAITPAARSVAAAEFRMHGTIRIGRWRAFSAVQTLVPNAGFVWAARTRIAGLPVRGYDSYADGRGHQRWRALGAIPMLSASGFDVTLSAAHRLAGELVLVPPALTNATWSKASTADCATYEVGFADHEGCTHVTIRVANDGRLTGVFFNRWGNPFGTGFGLYGFDVVFDGEYQSDGVRIGHGMRAAWIDHAGRRQEFYRAWIDSARFTRGGQGICAPVEDRRPHTLGG